MKLISVSQTAAFGIFTLLASQTALAAPVTIDSGSVRDSQTDTIQWGIGFTTSLTERPFVGVDTQQESLAYLSGRYKRFAVEGLDFTFDLLPNENSNLALLVTPRYYEVKASFADDGELNGIDTTNPTWFAGVLYRHQFAEHYHLNANAIVDVGNESDGTEVNLSVNRPFQFDSFSLVPSAGITWQDEELVTHFYGVSNNEVTPTRPLYEDESSLNYNATLTGIWQPHKHWRLLGAIKTEKLGSGISDSPIIEDDTINSVLAGVVFEF